MNSHYLKEHHADVYQKFFTEHQCVISAPFVMNWSGDVLNNYSWVSIKQKIPLRLYIGYSRTEGKDIRFKKITYLDLNEEQFIQTNLLEYWPYFIEIQNYLQKKYSHLTDLGGWIEISVLSELPRSVGLGFWSVFSLLLSTLLHRIQDTVLPSEIDPSAQENINNLLVDHFCPFYKIFLESLELDKHMYSMVSSGTKLAAFFDTQYPVVSFCEDFNKNTIHIDVSTKRFFGFRLNELFSWLREIPYSPMDYGLIYSGKPVLLEQIAGDQYKSNSVSAKEIKTGFRDLFGEYLQELPPNQRPRFYKHLIWPETDEFDAVYGKLMGIISLKILYSMGKMYSEGYDEFNMFQLLDSLRKRRQGDCVTRDSSSALMDVIKHLLEHFRWPAKHFSLVPNDSSIMWWSLIFATPLEGFRNDILESIEKTQTDFGSAKLLYANWIDGIEETGLKIEQDLKQNIYSSFLESNNCILRRMNGRVLITDCESSIASHKKGILLDTLHNKIYIDGEKLTSQDLHSQSATIEIVRYLMQHLGKEIPNKELPISGYSKNKNEMVSKIVLPLIDLVERKIGKRLPLICKGSLYDFYMKLNPSDIDIAIISRFSPEEFY